MPTVWFVSDFSPTQFAAHRRSDVAPSEKRCPTEVGHRSGWRRQRTRYARGSGPGVAGTSSQPSGNAGARHAGSGANDTQDSSHQRSSRSSIAPIVFPSARVAPTCSAVKRPSRTRSSSFSSSLKRPRPVHGDPDVELEILRVVPDRGAPERLLQVDVPAGEPAVRSLPEVPDGVRLSGPLQHEHAVSLPGPRPLHGCGRPSALVGNANRASSGRYVASRSGASSTTTTVVAIHGVPRQISRRTTISPRRQPTPQAYCRRRCTLRLPMTETHVREAAVGESDAGGAPELSVVVTLYDEARRSRSSTAA